MKMWQKATIGLGIAAASVLSLKAQSFSPFRFIDKQIANDTLPVGPNKLWLKTDKPVQGPYTYIDTLEYSTTIQVALFNHVKLGLGETEMNVGAFDPINKSILLNAVNPDAAVQLISLKDSARFTYMIGKGSFGEGAYRWMCYLEIPDHPQADGSYYPVQVHLRYAGDLYNNKMELDSLWLPMERVYATTKGERQVHFYYESLPEMSYNGVHMPPHVKMTTDATFSAMRAQSLSCPDIHNPKNWQYPTTVLTSMTTYPKGDPFQDMYQDADPQCGVPNPAKAFYQNGQGTYIRKDTTWEWLGAGGGPPTPTQMIQKRGGRRLLSWCRIRHT